MKFDKYAFARILKTLKSYYGTITELAKKTSVNRPYISQYINCRYDAPPSPKILRRLAEGSGGLFTFLELMHICGYFTEKEFDILKRGDKK